MVISRHDGSFIKATFGNTTLAVNPVSKKSKLGTTSFGADIALISVNHEDFNGVDQIGRGEKQPFVIDGPGEYEIGGVTVTGVQSGANGSLNTVYVATLENIRLCFLGALSSKTLNQQMKEALEDIDILFVPVSSETLSAGAAHELSVMLESNIVIPVHYSEKELKAFLKESGQEDVKPIDKLSIKKRELDDKEGEVVVLT